jgi:hypothetical protein
MCRRSDRSRPGAQDSPVAGNRPAYLHLKQGCEGLPLGQTPCNNSGQKRGEVIPSIPERPVVEREVLMG